MSLEDVNRKTQDFSFLSPSILKWFEASPLRHDDVILYLPKSCDGGREKGKGEGHCRCECLQSLLLFDLKSLNLSTFLLNESGSSGSLKQLLPFLNHISHLAPAVSSRSFRLEWTHMAEILDATWTRLISFHVGHHYLALLQITAVTQRILGKVFLLRGKTVPFLLRDLLDTREMKTLLGEDLVAFLKTLIGSVHGLNVRNLAWHGFLGVPDIRREHSLVLLFALHKVGEALNGKTLPTGPAPLVLPEAEGLLAPNICLEEDPLEIISNSSLVYAVMLPLWREAVVLISRRVKEVVLLVLPLLENALRVLYATVNGCPARILTATNSSFYVTMDEILSPWMTTPSSPAIEDDDASSDRTLQPNFVPQYLGRQLTEALYDLFHYPSGPRLRDRVSHGEALPESVPFGMTCHLFRLCLLVLSAERWRFLGDFSRFTIRCSCESVSEGPSPRKCFPHYTSETEAFLISSFTSSSSPLCPLNTRLVSYVASYESSFHPSPIFRKTLLEALESLEGWKDWARPLPHLVPESCWQDYDAASDPLYGLKWHTVYGSYEPRNLNEISDVKALVTLACSNPTLFSSKLELEIIRTLQRVLNCLQKVLSNLCSSLAARHSSYVSKTMRSRQREAYVRQLRSLPGVASHLFAALQLLRLVFSFSGKWKCAEASVASPFKALLKHVLKATENLVSFTDPSVNNYHQAFETLKQNTQTICNCFRDERSHLP